MSGDTQPVWLHASATDAGRKRTRNEDSLWVSPQGMFAVADGMGGHSGGAEASGMAVRMLAEAWAGEHEVIAPSVERPSRSLLRRITAPLEAVVAPPLPDHLRASVTATQDRLKQVVREIARAIYDTAQADEALRGMGTTLTTLVAEWTTQGWVGTVAHAGDSRLYLLRDGLALQVTRDHTWIAEQLAKGQLTPEAAAGHRYRHLITRSLGVARATDAEYLSLKLLPGDVLVLCSDGFSNYLAETADLTRLLATHGVEGLPEAGVAMANSRGGDDNVTVVAACVPMAPGA